MSGERSPKPTTTRPQGGDEYPVLACGALVLGFYGFWLLYPSVEVPPPERVSSSAEAGNTANTRPTRPTCPVWESVCARGEMHVSVGGRGGVMRVGPGFSMATWLGTW
eukprot:6128060-Prymnesium_polylepis.1